MARTMRGFQGPEFLLPFDHFDNEEKLFCKRPGPGGRGTPPPWRTRSNLGLARHFLLASLFVLLPVRLLALAVAVAHRPASIAGPQYVASPPQTCRRHRLGAWARRHAALLRAQSTIMVVQLFFVRSTLFLFFVHGLTFVQHRRKHGAAPTPVRALYTTALLRAYARAVLPDFVSLVCLNLENNTGSLQ